MEIITTSFNEKGGLALRDFLRAHGKPNLNLQAFIDDINDKEIFNGLEQIRSDYEISSSCTKSGNPILFDLLPEYFDFEVEGRIVDKERYTHEAQVIEQLEKAFKS